MQGIVGVRHFLYQMSSSTCLWPKLHLLPLLEIPSTMLSYKVAELRIQTLFQQYCKHVHKYSQILHFNLSHQYKYKICWFKEVMLGGFYNNKTPQTNQNTNKQNPMPKRVAKLEAESGKPELMKFQRATNMTGFYWWILALS